MQNLLRELLATRQEGLWWDFKQKFHDDLLDMLYDIVCLANVIHDGERYIIFGVSNQYEITGLDPNDKNYTQADIINYLRQQPFAENNIPQIKLDAFVYKEKNLAILTVSNERLKPYYLTKEIKSKQKLIRAGSVYSRIGDTNTPKDSCANPKDIHAMWKERFGLDLPAGRRFSYILEDIENWNYNGIDGAFYELDPDFTIQFGETDETQGQYWWQNALVESPVKYNYLLKFKNTVLHEVPVIHFRDENLQIPFPSIEFITYPDKSDGLQATFYCDLFYYQKGTLEYSLLIHLRSIESKKPDFTTPLVSQIKPPIIKLPFFIINSDLELMTLKESLLTKFNEFSSKQDEIIRSSVFKGKTLNRWQIERVFSEWAHALLK